MDAALALSAGHVPHNIACKPLGGFHCSSNTTTDGGRLQYHGSFTVGFAEVGSAEVGSAEVGSAEVGAGWLWAA